LDKIQTAEDPNAANSDNHHHHTKHLQSSQNTDEFGVSALQHSAVERSDNTSVLNVDHAELHDSPNTTTNVISELAIHIFDFCDIRSLDQEFQAAVTSDATGDEGVSSAKSCAVLSAEAGDEGQ